MKYQIYQGNPRTDKQAKLILTTDDFDKARNIVAEYTNRGEEAFFTEVAEPTVYKLDPMGDFARQIIERQVK